MHDLRANSPEILLKKGEERSIDSMIISTFIAFIIILASAAISGSGAALFFSLFTFVAGHLFCLTVPLGARDNARKVFNVVLSLSIVFALLHYFELSEGYQSFVSSMNGLGGDEYSFWILSEEISNYSSLTKIINDCFVDRIHIENEGYIFYIGLLAYASEILFDGNHLFLQCMGSVFFGALLSIVIYKILLLYFDSKKSANYTLLYSLLSVVFAFSFKLIRDVHIAFFYAVSIYVVLLKFSVRGLLVLILNVLILWQLRFEHGLFALVFIAYYLYERIKRNIPLVVLLAISVLSIFIVYFWDALLSAQAGMDHYVEYTNDAVMSKNDSLGSYVYLFPPPLREIIIVFLSQIQPFPSWISMNESLNTYASIIASHDIIRTFFWYIVFYSMILWILFNKIYKRVPSKLKYLLLITFVFLFFNASNMHSRRIMCLFPIIFLIYVWIKEYCISYSKYFRTNILLAFTYLSLIIVYLVVKYLI